MALDQAPQAPKLDRRRLLGWLGTTPLLGSSGLLADTAEAAVPTDTLTVLYRAEGGANAPVRLDPAVQTATLALEEEFTKRGFQRLKIDGAFFEIADTPPLDKKLKHDIDVVVDHDDKLDIRIGNKGRQRRLFRFALGPLLERDVAMSARRAGDRHVDAGRARHRLGRSPRTGFAQPAQLGLHRLRPGAPVRGRAGRHGPHRAGRGARRARALPRARPARCLAGAAARPHGGRGGAGAVRRERRGRAGVRCRRRPRRTAT